jgi:AraC family transcriptional regulator of adaptative response/methylated-DNA-[protein]-cysteine methyltransferase
MNSKNGIGRGLTSPKRFFNNEWIKKPWKSDFENPMVGILEMTPDEHRNGGAFLSIHYHFAESPFGSVLVASTWKGVCYMAFYDGEKEEAMLELKKHYPNAKYFQYLDNMQQTALFLFTQEWSRLNRIKLHVRGTPFQLQVWEVLLNIPVGALYSYSKIAERINNGKAYRAVGSAIGSNPVAFLIPCHRVIKSSGDYGNYHWGKTRKIAMIEWEAKKHLKSKTPQQ